MSESALQPGVRRREVFGWAMYDFANSGYTTVVITAVFAAYFVGGVAGNAAWATFAWTAALSVSYAIVMFGMPALGAYADLHAAKKRLLAFTTTGCVLATAALGAVGPGDVALAVLLIILSHTCYSVGESLIAAFLPELARPKAMGKVSGWGWGLGYAGGMLALGLSLAYVLSAQARKVSADDFVPVTLWITAALYGAAALVTFALLRERAVPRASATASTPALMSAWGAWRASMVQLRTTLRRASDYRDFVWLLACATCYQAGVAVAIALAAIYAESVIGFEKQETMILIFALNVAAMTGALLFGHLQDRIGHRVALALTLLGWIATCVLAAASQTKADFWWAAGVAGLCMGSSQSAGRAMAALLAPPAQSAEFFGLWSFATRLAAVIGPLSYGAITWATGGDQRTAILWTTVFFAAGLALLWRVDLARGQAAARPAG